MNKVLVTGGAGFIGSHLVDKLLSEGHNVAVMDDFSGGNVDNLSEKLDVVCTGDCRDEEVVDDFMRKFQPEIVYHLAANAAENKAQFSPIDITSRNYDAFIKVLTPFVKYGGKRFVFTSSIAVYGSLQTPFKEDDLPQPEDLYGVTKLAAEQSLEIMSDIHGFEYVIARPHNVYGPRQNMTDPYRNVVTIWMNQLLNYNPIVIYGDGSMKRCFSYIDDVIDPLYKCGFEDVSGMIFNIGSDESYSLSHLAAVMGAQDATYLPKREHEVQEAISDHTLLHEHLGYNETPLKEGIKKTWDWCKAQGPQEPIYTEIEIQSDKLPDNWKK